MKTFIVDKDIEYTYDKLLKDIINSHYYINEYKTHDIIQFLRNVLIAIINNKNIEIIDNDFDDKVIITHNIIINKKHKAVNRGLKTLEDIVKLIQKSNSEITLYTSGTTGQPKKIVHKVVNLRRYVKKGDTFAGHTWGLAYNCSHIAGLLVFFQAIENFNTIVNLFNKDREFIYQMIEKYNITNISATPTFYRLLLPTEREFKSLKYVTLGGEKADINICNNIKKAFPNAKINNIYASTEAGSLLTSEGEYFKIPDKFADKIKIINDELHIHKTLIGTFPDIKLINDYYGTNDLIEWIDKETGTFKFKGRKNELINVGGYNVNPSEVEESIRGIKGVKDVKVTGKKNSLTGNIITADIILENEVQLTEKDVKIYLLHKLQEYKIPRLIKFTNNITLTRTGKMERK